MEFYKVLARKVDSCIYQQFEIVLKAENLPVKPSFLRKGSMIMEKPSSSKTELTVLRDYFWMLLILWTVLVGSILLWSLVRQKHETEQVARIQAISSLEKDIVYRQWAAGHGGIYVPITDKTVPNPYLSHIEERDIITPSGRILTLINPAYMTRQVHEVGLERYGSHGHITSLKPIRPANAADEWETKALQAFEQGIKEVSSIEKLDDQDYMRLMRPMITEQGCLKCHAGQGYKPGDLRGGISISVPMAPIQAIARGHALTLSVGHIVLWLLGVGGIGFGGQRLKQRIQEHKYAEEQIENLAKFPSENPNPVLRIAKDGILLYANSASESFLAEWGCKTGQPVPTNWQKMVSEAFVSGIEKRIEVEHEEKTYSFVIAQVTEAGYANLYGRDITERKQAEEAMQESEKKYRILFEQSADATLIITGDKFIDCNHATVEMLGYTSKQELLQTHPSQLSPEFQPDGRSSFEKANEMMSIAFKQGSNRFEWDHKRRNGEVFPVEVLLTAISMRDQDFLHVVWRDITERKRIEKQIKNLAKFPAENPNPVLRIAKNGLLLFANDAGNSFLAEWKCQEGEIVPKNWCQTVSEVFFSGSS